MLANNTMSCQCLWEAWLDNLGYFWREPLYKLTLTTQFGKIYVKFKLLRIILMQMGRF